jgi:hypothetical protein
MKRGQEAPQFPDLRRELEPHVVRRSAFDAGPQGGRVHGTVDRWQ